MKQLEHPGVVAALLVLGVALVLSGCWDAPFDSGDDSIAVLWAAEHTPTELLKPKQYPVFPITLLSFKLDYLLFGPPASVIPRVALATPQHARMWAAGTRLMNGLYVLFAALALWSFLKRIGSGPVLAIAAATAWIVHPMSCESICWIAERKNVLAALFGFLALAVWVSEISGFWRWPLAYLLYALAIFSKPSALGVLPVFAIIEILSPNATELRLRREKEWLNSIERLICPIVISLLGVMYSSWALRHDVVPPPGGSAWTALLTDVSIFGQYIQHLLVPHNLSFYYYVEPTVSLSDARLWTFGLSIAVFLALLAWLSGAQRRLAIFGMIWFFAALGPNSNIVSSAFPMQDRFTFLGAPGLLLAIFLAVHNSVQRWSKAPAAGFVLIAGYILVLAALTIRISPLYRNDSELKILAAERQPRSAFAQLGAASAHYQKALSIVSTGSAEGPQALSQNAQAALVHFGLAQQCPDYQYFENPFAIRVYSADLQRILNEFPKARATLSGWLPPEHLTLLADNQDHFRDEFRTGYPRALLIQAWIIESKSAMQESLQPMLSSERAIELRNQALHAVDEAVKLRPDDDSVLLKGRLLLISARLDTSDEIARAHYDSAVQLLQGLKSSSLWPLVSKMLSEEKRR